MVSTWPLTSKSSRPFNNPLDTVPKAPTTIGIIVTFMFHSFFNSLTRSRYLSLFSHSLLLLLLLNRVTWHQIMENKLFISDWNTSNLTCNWMTIFCIGLEYFKPYLQLNDNFLYRIGILQTLLATEWQFFVSDWNTSNLTYNCMTIFCIGLEYFKPYLQLNDNFLYRIGILQTLLTTEWQFFVSDWNTSNLTYNCMTIFCIGLEYFKPYLQLNDNFLYRIGILQTLLTTEWQFFVSDWNTSNLTCNWMTIFCIGLEYFKPYLQLNDNFLYRIGILQTLLTTVWQFFVSDWNTSNLTCNWMTIFCIGLEYFKPYLQLNDNFLYRIGILQTLLATEWQFFVSDWNTSNLTCNWMTIFCIGLEYFKPYLQLYDNFLYRIGILQTLLTTVWQFFVSDWNTSNLTCNCMTIFCIGLEYFKPYLQLYDNYLYRIEILQTLLTTLLQFFVSD